MIHTFQLHGLTLQTGDVICTMNGKPDILPGEFWRLVGRLVPGDVDHVAFYTGPGGLCVEAGSRGVIHFEIPGALWDTEKMARERGHRFKLATMSRPAAGDSVRKLPATVCEIAPRITSSIDSSSVSGSSEPEPRVTS